MTNYSEMAKIAKGKMLLKEYEQKDNSLSFVKKPILVYLEDGDEFQIQLFNPTNQVVGAKIEFNGEPGWCSSNKSIVLRPGERIWLERYLDSPHKFKFSTYAVSDIKEIREAIKDNGLLRIKFYYEDKTPCYDNTIITCSQPYHTYYYNGTGDNIIPNIILGSNNNSTVTACSGEMNTLSFAAPVSSSATGYYTASKSLDLDGEVTRCRSSHKSKSIETGRVEEGSYSRQDFNHVYYNFASCPFFTKEIQIMPMSRKQYGKNDLHKVYCTNCGKKLSGKFNFCPACGTKVNH